MLENMASAIGFGFGMLFSSGPFLHGFGLRGRPEGGTTQFTDFGCRGSYFGSRVEGFGLRISGQGVRV